MKKNEPSQPATPAISQPGDWTWCCFLGDKPAPNSWENSKIVQENRGLLQKNTGLFEQQKKLSRGNNRLTSCAKNLSLWTALVFVYSVGPKTLPKSYSGWLWCHIIGRNIISRLSRQVLSNLWVKKPQQPNKKDSKAWNDNHQNPTWSGAFMCVFGVQIPPKQDVGKITRMSCWNL